MRPFLQIPSIPRLPRLRTLGLAAAALVAVPVGVVAIEALVRARLGDSFLHATTRLYARPTILRPGTHLDPKRLASELDRLDYHKTRGRVGVGEYRVRDDVWIIGRRPFRLAGETDPGGVVTVSVDWNGIVEEVKDTSGHRLASVMIEPEALPVPGVPDEERLPVRLADLPGHLSDAVLAVEDRRFRRHRGLDVARIAGAAIANVKAGRIRQGGSTITQQLAKNLFLTSRRTPVRKIREAAMALVLEARYSKELILEYYLNEVYLGQHGSAAVHGVGAAAQLYFGKDARGLTQEESALLAGLIRGPNLYEPFQRPEAAQRRRNQVLAMMLETGSIGDSAYRRAVARPIGVRRATSPIPTRAGRHFVDFVESRLKDVAGGDLATGGRTTFTTLDMHLQIAAEEAVRNGLLRLERDEPSLSQQRGQLEAALVALDPQTGAILAMVGGRNYGVSQFNRAADARRQPGSAFKPVVAIAALSERTFTLASVLEDQPFEVPTVGGLWHPANYDGQFRGPVTLRHALEASLNVPFARLGVEIGSARIAEVGRSLGIASPLAAVPSLALGSSGVTPLEMAGAFAVFAAGGVRTEPHAMLSVIDANGDVLERSRFETRRVFTAAESFLITTALQGAVERGTGRGLLSYDLGPVAAKSGTSSDYRDAWFVGYTPSIVVAVWVGYDDERSLGVTGSRAALPIFGQFFVNGGLQNDQDFTPPPDLETAIVDPSTGLIASWSCGGEREYFLPGTVPPQGTCSPIRVFERLFTDGPGRIWEGLKSIFGGGRERN